MVDSPKLCVCQEPTYVRMQVGDSKQYHESEPSLCLRVCDLFDASLMGTSIHPILLQQTSDSKQVRESCYIFPF